MKHNILGFGMDQFVRQHIEGKAEALRRRIKSRCLELWPDGEPGIADMYDPRVACDVLGISYFEFPYFEDRFSGQPGGSVAGVLDRQRNTISVATNFSNEEIRFTTAHEVGHWVLHEKEVLHRDKPVDAHFLNSDERPQIEREADYFAACFLMPGERVAAEFQIRFGSQIPFEINEDVAFWLAPTDVDSLLNSPKRSMKRALALASAHQFNGRPFDSLAEKFKVSKSAMAIRLLELSLFK